MRFQALYDDGIVDLEVAAAPEGSSDVMLFSGGKPGSTLLAETAHPGNTVYLAAFRPDDQAARRSKGAVTSRVIQGFHVDTHADFGWSGGIIVSPRGKLVGMVLGDTPQHIKQVNAMSAETMYICLRTSTTRLDSRPDVTSCACTQLLSQR